jgi:hypothetical protein
MTTYAYFEWAAIFAGLAAALFAARGAFRLSRLPQRPPAAALVPEYVVACLLVGICNICTVLSEPLAETASWRIGSHLLAAALFFGMAVRLYLRARHHDAPESGA